MKQLLAVVLATLMSFYSVPTLGAENPRTFTSPEQAATALCTGQFTPYVWHVPAKSPVTGEDRMTETPLVVELDTNEGRRFIPVPTGGHLLFEGNQPVGWPGCRNKIWSWKALDPCPEPVVATPPPVAEEKPDPTPVEPIKLDLEVRVKYDPPPTTPPPATTGLVVKKKNHTVLYVIGGILLGGGIAALASGGGGKKTGSTTGTTGGNH